MSLLEIVCYSEVFAFWRFHQNSQFLNFLPFCLLNEEMQTFSEKIGFI